MSDTEQKTPISKSKAENADSPKRHIMRWDWDLDQLLILSMEKVWKEEAKQKIPWDKVAKEINNNATGGSIDQHIAKIRKKRIEAGQRIVPKPQRQKKADRLQDLTPLPSPAKATPLTPDQKTRKRRAATKRKYRVEPDDPSSDSDGDLDPISDMDGEYGVSSAAASSSKGKKRGKKSVVKEEPLDDESIGSSPKKPKLVQGNGLNADFDDENHAQTKTESDEDEVVPETPEEEDESGEDSSEEEDEHTDAVVEKVESEAADAGSKTVTLRLEPSVLANFPQNTNVEHSGHFNATEMIAPYGYGPIGSSNGLTVDHGFSNMVPGQTMIGLHQPTPFLPSLPRLGLESNFTGFNFGNNYATDTNAYGIETHTPRNYHGSSTGSSSRSSFSSSFNGLKIENTAGHNGFSFADAFPSTYPATVHTSPNDYFSGMNSNFPMAHNDLSMSHDGAGVGQFAPTPGVLQDYDGQLYLKDEDTHMPSFTEEEFGAWQF